MNKAKISILLAVHDKNSCLYNTLFSIRNQQTKLNYNLCFIDHGSKEDPLPIIEKFFSKDEYVLKRVGEDVGFELIRKEFLEIIPKETKLIIWQSCDIIWEDRYLLSKAVSAMQLSNLKYKYKRNNFRKDVVCVPQELKNFLIPENLYCEPETFYSILTKLEQDKELSGHQQDLKYLYWAAIDREVFCKAINTKIYNTDATCDVTLREKIFKRMKLDLLKINSSAIHQKHEHIIVPCSSINKCTNPCKFRRKLIANSIPLPLVIGSYDFKTKKFKKMPNI